MAYDEGLAQRIEDILADGPVEPKKMFGGVAYMWNGNMAVCVMGSELMVRVGKDATTAMLQEPHAREMEMSGRTMGGWVLVAEAGVAEDADLQQWVQRGVAYTDSLPPK